MNESARIVLHRHISSESAITVNTVTLNFGRDGRYSITEKDHVNCGGFVPFRVWCYKLREDNSRLRWEFFRSLLSQVCLEKYCSPLTCAGKPNKNTH
jgi:hypothetical protein